ncbi:PH domain-containing protein [uncultured Flavobacterium sp.]|uniref:PH domain-containing protein n=1 Tax=uncultured Flavobacterium sp. TaxID=165435 RepID=UPI0030EEBD1B|tara:strand:+ start:255634 stop:256065 length:432 start_codon:yes stop_codon:yes gene_type:complete
MKVYKSKKSKRLNVIFILTFIIIIGVTIPALLNDIGNEFYIVVGINLLTLLLLLSIILKTEYRIKNNQLYWQSGPFYGKIDIKTIIKIKHHDGIFVPTVWKPALSQVGLIITYNKYDDIYLSPQNEADFIVQLLEINPTIEII